MLTSAAWNAFLKTLEEPPPNTVFVLATTDANKILPTVADRCHRFDFTRPTVEQIATVLRRAADHESIEIPADALALVARYATGSFRDALGTLEQLVTYSGRSIALDDVLAVLGVADADLLFEALEAVGAHDPRRALLCAAKLAESGRDASSFIRDLEAHARDLLVVGTLGEVPAEVAMTPDRDTRLAEQAERVPRGDVIRLLELLAAALGGIKDGAEARTQLELALVKAAQPRVDASTQALLSRLDRLEQQLAGRAPAPAPQPARFAAAAPPAPSPQPQQPQPQQPQPQPSHGGGREAPWPEDPGPEQPPGPHHVEPPAPSEPAPAPPAPAHANGRALHEPEPEPPGAEAAHATATATAQVEQAPPEVQHAVDHLGGSLDLAGVRATWPAVVDIVKGQNLMLGAAIIKARPHALDGEELTLAFSPDDSFAQRKAADQACRQLVTEAIRQLTGQSLRLAYTTADATQIEAETAAPALSEDEIIDRFKAEFEAEEIVPQDDEEPTA